ncbi:hypothetical protein ABZP36_028143 [Zizania latifolia]
MASDYEGMAALISMYNDDEEEDDADEPRPPSPPPPAAATSSSPSPRTEGENSNPHLNSAPSSAPLSPPLAEDPAGRNFEENTPSDTVHILTPNIRSEMSQRYNAPEQNQVGTTVAMSVAGTETEDAQVEEAADNIQNDDPLSCFLPPPVTTKCSAALQQKINKFLAYKRAGKSFNSEVRNRKDYRNPDFLQHAVRYQEIDQIGTCFSKDVFDPYGYDRSDYYDEIEADMKREVERKELEKKKSGKVDFINGGVQATISAAIPKIAAAVSAAAVAGAPLVLADGVKKEARPNKKSKWDKVDGDIKNPAAPNGHDNLSAAALLTSANVGAGYAAFAQQKRK